MLPIGDENPQINTPYATYLIIGINAIAWILLQGAGFGQELQSSVCQYGLIPAHLFNDGFTPINNTHCESGARWLGLLSSMFMHGSWMHILGNMWFLYIFGDNVEDAMGAGRFTLFYFLSGLLAAAAQVAADLQSVIPMVGASGAIGGVMGGYIMLYPKVKVKMLLILIIIFTTIRVPAFAMLGYWILVQILGSISSLNTSGGGTAFWAHVGGFVGGAILVWVFKDQELLLNHPHHGWQQSTNPRDIWDDPSNRQ